MSLAAGAGSPAFVDHTLAGERNKPSVNLAVSVQSRVSRVLALGLVGVLGLGLLIWYYSNTIHRQARARESAKLSVGSRAQGEMDLPSLGRIDPPTASGAEARPVQDRSPPVLPPDEPYASDLPALAASYGESGASSPYGPGPHEKTPAQLALERRLAGTAFARSTQSTADASLDNGLRTGEGVASGDGDKSAQRTSLATLLQASVIPAVAAERLPTRQLLLPRGAFIDCTLETAIDSTLPGMTTCITATDTFSADGKVVLLERGSKLIGETRGAVQLGSRRVFVLWTEVRTPYGVVVPLDSPGTDELGRSGLAGRTERHFWDRFGAGILISIIDGAMQSVAQDGNRGGTVIYSPASSRDLMTEVLKDTVNIPPTVVKPQGDRVQVLVARDLDFRSVYELRSASAVR